MRKLLDEVNMDALFKITILLGFALFLALIVQNGQVLMYVHPRIVPYLKFAIIAVIPMAVFTLPDLRRKHANTSCLTYLVFILPLITAFTLPPQAMDASTVSFSAAETGSENLSNDRENTPASTSEGESKLMDPGAATGNSSPEGEAEASDSKLKMIDGKIIIDDDNYYQWSEEIFMNMNAYAGKRIETTGFIMRSEELQQNDFALVRLLMTCCAADTVPIGFLCRWENNIGIENNAWMKVSGTIEVVDYNGQNVPLIIADKLEKTSKPDNEYVYPY